MTPVSRTTFSPHHLVPEGSAMLSCSCLMPDGWVNVPLPDETYDLDKPGVFLPLLVCMAPYDSGDSTERDRARLGWFSFRTTRPMPTLGS